MTSVVPRHGLCKETGMLPFLSCDCEAIRGFRCVRGKRERHGDTKATSDSKDQFTLGPYTRTNGFYRGLGDSSD